MQIHCDLFVVLYCRRHYHHHRHRHPGLRLVVIYKARFKRRTSHVPNLIQMRKIYCFRSFALDLAHVKFDV